MTLHDFMQQAMPYLLMALIAAVGLFVAWAQSKIKEIRAGQAESKQEQVATRKEIKETKEDVKETKEDVKVVRDEVSVVKADMHEVMVATDGMKSALVASTERAAMAEGKEAGRIDEVARRGVETEIKADHASEIRDDIKEVPKKTTDMHFDRLKKDDSE